MINILVNGATGKMGQLAVTHIQADADLNLVATPSHDADLQQSIMTSKPDIVLDLTAADVVYQNTKIIIESGCTPVIGTSGLTANQINTLKQLAKQHKVGGLVIPNFSIGAVLMMQFAATASRYFNHIEIIETHHLDKKDKPSGTARRTAEIIAQTKSGHFDDINITSHRTAKAIAEQDVIFKTDFEILTIKHNSFNRECFMSGVILACKKAVELTALSVGLETVL
jgi:4-hydroxy-tetrahydrodipicolinate reductase